MIISVDVISPSSPRDGWLQEWTRAFFMQGSESWRNPVHRFYKVVVANFASLGQSRVLDIPLVNSYILSVSPFLPQVLQFPCSAVPLT